MVIECVVREDCTDKVLVHAHVSGHNLTDDVAVACHCRQPIAVDDCVVEGADVWSDCLKCRAAKGKPGTTFSVVRTRTAVLFLGSTKFTASQNDDVLHVRAHIPVEPQEIGRALCHPAVIGLRGVCERVCAFRDLV